MVMELGCPQCHSVTSLGTWASRCRPWSTCLPVLTSVRNDVRSQRLPLTQSCGLKTALIGGARTLFGDYRWDGAGQRARPLPGSGFPACTGNPGA